jgi:2-hydroxy-3-keto-5-methylthiopentenyl-1-phosphate phosphatase
MLEEKQTTQRMLFIDFDGTITRRDVVDAILEEFADFRWLRIEEHWQKGRIGSRDCLRAQMALVRATQTELDAFLDSIEVDDDLPLLLETCSRHQIPAHIVSDGFDYCIRRIIERPQLQLGRLLRNVRICASHLDLECGWLRTDFPFFRQVCEHGCATCKPAVMRLLNRTGAQTIFVGDGLSDRYMAQVADLVFAKNSLATYCFNQSIDYIPFEDFAVVAAWLAAPSAEPANLANSAVPLTA